MSEQSAAFPGGYRGGACYQFGLGGPFNNRIVTGPAVVGSKRQRMESHAGLDGSCIRAPFPTSGMCAPGVVCIGPSDTSITRSSEISYVSPGQTTEVRVNAESKGKDATSMYPSQDLLVPVPGAPLEVIVPIYVIREQMCRCLHL